MSIDLLKIKPWGPVPLREIVGELQDAINERTPIKGLGITLDERPTGFQVGTESTIDAGLDIANSAAPGGSANGTNVDIYGAQNGVPSLLHLLQTSPPTPVTP